MASKHQYRITVEYVADNKGNPVEVTPLVFTAGNHDDILALAARAKAAGDKDLAFLVGLKLFGECLLEDRDNPLYAELLPHFGAFMKKLKAARQGEG